MVEFTPTAPGENEVQVENKAIGINYIDTYIRGGLYPPPSMPSGLGTEAAGVVVKVGSAVKHIKEGDRVVYAQSPLGAYSSVHNVPADKAALLPNAISFEQAAASFLKGLTVYYLLRKTYEIKPDEQFLFHAAAGGVGLIACQWAKALGAKLIGTVGNAQKAQRALQAGAWQVINYREESIVERLKEITSGKKVYVTRPSLQGYITNREELEEASNELFSLIASGVIKVDVAEAQKYPLADAQRAHEVLESRATQGSSLLIP
ncbi:MAG: NADPH:quinone reductase [Enterobacter sp.]|nr:NADPH:quinone reductase [Enterobacter sp.]